MSVKVAESYKTVASPASVEIVERKSRFISYVAPAGTAEEAMAHVAKIRAKHPDATHNVYAFVVREQNAQRHSDDGEPSGTAGLPVLEVIKGEGLVDVCVVVTRYFGGILLGTGGLVRAYSKSAKEGILAAGITTKVLCSEYSITVDYPLFNRLTHALGARGFYVGDVRYSDTVTLSVFARQKGESALLEIASEISGGSARVEKAGEGYIDLEKFSF